MASYEVYFANAGVPATGLTLTWESLNERDGGGAVAQPSFTEVAGGWYRFDLTVTETVLGVIDGSATLGDSDRYVPCKFTTNDESLDTTVSSRSDFDESTDGVNTIQISGSSTAADNLEQSASAIQLLTIDTTTTTPTTSSFEVTEITSGDADNYNGRIGIFRTGNLLGQAFEVTDFSIQNGRGFFTVQTKTATTLLTQAPSSGDTWILL